jgi:transposase
MARQKRRKFTWEFKVEAIRKVVIDDRTYTDVGKEVGVSQGVLGRWVREFTEDEHEAFPGKGVRKSKDQEIFELKRELEGLREERDILKKAVAVFSRHQR